MMTRVVIAILAVVSPRAAEACSLIGPQPYLLDPDEQAVDTTPPSAVTVLDLQMGRGKSHSGCSASSCDDIGSIYLEVDASDDRSAPDDLGYELRVSGSLPDGLAIPSGPVTFWPGAISLAWIDRASDNQESFRFDLEIRAVDRAGNLGPPVVVEIADDGSGWSCQLARGGGSNVGLVLGVIAVAVLLRRRKPSA